MATKMKVKKGDMVQILTGKDRGKRGRVIEARPSERRVIVENLNVAKRHTKPRPIRDSSRMGGTQIVPGGILDKPAPDPGLERHGRLPRLRQPDARRDGREGGRRARSSTCASASARAAARRSTSDDDARRPPRPTCRASRSGTRARSARSSRRSSASRRVMDVPRVTKVTLNMGVGEAKTDAKALDAAIDELTIIAGQRAQVRRATKSIASFKLREGMPVGARVTLRGARMYEFLDRLASIALPRIRDFRGLDPGSFDGRGNYSIGIREQIIFPEIDYDKVPAIRGLDVAITTSAKTDEHGRALLGALGLPFAASRREQQ